MKKKIYEILRKYVAKRATGNLGKVKISDDEIICYVDGKKLKKKEKYLHRYNLIFRCIPSSEETYRIYRVDKPVHYIIENVDFDMEINIMASMKNCHVTFENCTFTAGVGIDFADHLTFKNNIYSAQSYKNYRSIYKEGEFCISTKAIKDEVNKIEFINDAVEVEDLQFIPIIKGTDVSRKTYHEKNPIVQIWLYAKEIIFKNSDISDVKSIEIGADELYLTKANISSEETEINAETICLNESKIKSKVISIQSCIIDGKINIEHNGLFINGIEVNKNNKNIELQELKEQKRIIELISTLKKIEIISEETIIDEMKREPLTRVLKNKGLK